MVRRVKVLGSTYKITYKKRMDNDLIGHAKHVEKQIDIAANIVPESQRQTLLHECVHAIDYEHGFKWKEDMVERVTNAFYGFMIDNKEFIREIVK